MFLGADMKRTNQTHSGNVTGSGHTFRGLHAIAIVPRKSPLPRQVRRFLRATRGATFNMPKWTAMSPLLDSMFRKAGLMAPPESA